MPLRASVVRGCHGSILQFLELGTTFFSPIQKKKKEAMHCDAMDKTKSFKGFTIIQRQSRTGILNGKELKKKSTIKENEKSYNLLTM